jgi:hypothetical protein
MMMDFDSEGFGQLLSEALRAGPGSPAWHDAVEKVRSGGVSGGEDYALLLAARESLESGKGFRRIRPGPAFTARIMAAVDSTAMPSGKPRRNWTAGIIAILAVAAMLVAAVLIVRMLIPAGPVARQTLADLESQTFANEVSIRFNGEAPAGWRTIGSLTPSFNGEMSPPASAGDQDYQGCGIVSQTALAPDQPAAIEVTLRLGEPTDQVIAQVFVTDQPDFSPDRGISPHELTWTLQPLPAAQRKSVGGGAGSRRQFEPQVVLPDGTFAPTGQNVPKPRDTITIRLEFNQQFAVVESDGKRLYAGPHQLSADQPRYVGVRFLRRGEVKRRDLCSVLSVRTEVQ